MRIIIATLALAIASCGQAEADADVLKPQPTAIVEGVDCFGGLQGDVGTAPSTLAYWYRYSRFNTGDVFVYGAIVDQLHETGASTMNKASSTDPSLIMFIADSIGSPNAGYWALSKQGKAVQIAYFDNDVAVADYPLLWHGKMSDCEWK